MGRGTSRAPGRGVARPGEEHLPMIARGLGHGDAAADVGGPVVVVGTNRPDPVRLDEHCVDLEGAHSMALGSRSEVAIEVDEPGIVVAGKPSCRAARSLSPARPTLSGTSAFTPPTHRQQAYGRTGRARAARCTARNAAALGESSAWPDRGAGCQRARGGRQTLPSACSADRTFTTRAIERSSTSDCTR